MQTEEFELIVEECIDSIRNTLKQKALEYSQNFDRLHNFRVASEILNCSKEKALLGFATKHLVSVIDLVNSIEQEYQRNKMTDTKFQTGLINEDLVNEKIGDLINYLILLKACIIDTKNNK